MDIKFHPALRAIKDDDLQAFRDLLEQDPSLATARSTRGHPTLLQALVLDAVDQPNAVEMAKLLIDGGANIDEALVAAASMDNAVVAELLLDRGANIDGTGAWSPLEEALYWNNKRAISLLLTRGAQVGNLRTAAALGRVDLLKEFFDSQGLLKAEAGILAWPFGKPKVSWMTGSQAIIDNAFIYACMHNQVDAAAFLLDHGAQINEIPPGFDYAGTGLHYAALNGHRPMVDFLLSKGADVKVKDAKVNSTPSGWADHGGHKELSLYLER